MGDIHGITARKLEILTENTGLQPILCATFAQLARFVQEKSPACAQAGDVIFLVLPGFVFSGKGYHASLVRPFHLVDSRKIT